SDLDHDSRSWLDRESFGVALGQSSQGEVFLPDHEVRETHHAPVAPHTRYFARTRGGFSGLKRGAADVANLAKNAASRPCALRMPSRIILRHLAISGCEEFGVHPARSQGAPGLAVSEPTAVNLVCGLAAGSPGASAQLHRLQSLCA